MLTSLITSVLTSAGWVLFISDITGQRIVSCNCQSWVCRWQLYFICRLHSAVRLTLDGKLMWMNYLCQRRVSAVSGCTAAYNVTVPHSNSVDTVVQGRWTKHHFSGMPESNPLDRFSEKNNLITFSAAISLHFRPNPFPNAPLGSLGER